MQHMLRLMYPAWQLIHGLAPNRSGKAPQTDVCLLGGMIVTACVRFALQDPALWRRLAAMSQEQGFFRQAIYCLNRVLFTNRSDLSAQWDRIVLFATIGEHRKVSVRHASGPFTKPRTLLRDAHVRSVPRCIA